MKFKVSVIMAVYNEEEYVEKAVMSLLQQTLNNIEIVICDDSSTDSSYDILIRLANRFSNIILIRNETNMGLAYSLNRCIELSHGEFLARMDADDISLPRRLEKQLFFLEKHTEYDLVGCQYIMFDENNNQLYSHKKSEPTEKVLPLDVPFAHPTILIRADSMRILGGYVVSKRTRRCEDLELWYRFFAAGMAGYNFNEYLYLKKQDISDYKNRKFRYGVDIFCVNIKGLTLIKADWIRYFFAIKSLIVSVVPKRLMIEYHKLRFKSSL